MANSGRRVSLVLSRPFFNVAGFLTYKYKVYSSVAHVKPNLNVPGAGSCSNFLLYITRFLTSFILPHGEPGSQARIPISGRWTLKARRHASDEVGHGWLLTSPEWEICTPPNYPRSGSREHLQTHTFVFENHGFPSSIDPRPAPTRNELIQHSTAVKGLSTCVGYWTVPAMALPYQEGVENPKVDVLVRPN